MTYRLTRRCERDIDDIHQSGVGLFGIDQAEKYQAGLQAVLELLAANPRLARERPELRPSVRLHPYRAHMIAYVEMGADILIVRVLHGRQDWARHLRI